MITNGNNIVFNFVETPNSGEYFCSNFIPEINQNYILKEDFQSLNSLINTIEDGGAVISPGVATWISDFFIKLKFNHPKLNLLTSREEQVIQCLSDGYTPHEISKLLDIKIGTTRVHIKSIYQKLHINSQLQLIRLLNEEKYK